MLRRQVIAALVLFCVLNPTPWVHAQDLSPSSENSATDSVPSTQALVPPPPSPDGISWKHFPRDILRDQTRIWLFPNELTRNKNWIPAAGFVLATAGLVALDSEDTPYFRRTSAFTGFNRIATDEHTIAAMALVPASLFVLGRMWHDRKMEQTVQLAAEAVVDSEIPTSPGAGCHAPPLASGHRTEGDFFDTWFRRHKGPFYLGPGGFPSGHTIAAVSIASVFADRYRQHRWVAWVAYGLAGVVGFSRVTRSAHFPS